jgi:hypothetical protein
VVTTHVRLQIVANFLLVGNRIVRRKLAERETVSMPKPEKAGRSSIVRLTAGWVMLFVLGVLIWTEFGPRTPSGYTPAPIRFVACRPMAAVAGAYLAAGLAFGFIMVWSAELLFGRTSFSRTRLTALVLIGTVLLFALSFAGALLLRRRMIGVCA